MPNATTTLFPKHHQQEEQLSPGRDATTILIPKNSTLALMHGTRYVIWVNQLGQLDAVIFIIFCKILGGLLECPLTKPA